MMAVIQYDEFPDGNKRENETLKKRNGEGRLCHGNLGGAIVTDLCLCLCSCSGIPI